MTKEKIKVLVVEDSPVVQALLVHVLNTDPDILVVGTGNNGREALEIAAKKFPDVILMDIHMPEMDGFEATRRIMESQPTPVVICSANGTTREAATGFRMMEAGAVACVEKPVGYEHEDFGAVAAHLRRTVKLMSEVKVVRRWPRRDGVKEPPCPVRRASGKIEVVGIGASTGGPPVLQTILAALPKDFPVPLLIVQHITPGFLNGLAEWLNQTTGMKVHIAAHDMQVVPGHVYLAPDNFHMSVRPDGILILSREKPESGLRPSIACLFRSLAEGYASSALGVLLTGMGKDGAQELKQMRDRGAMTIAQDRETSVVHGMPGEAISLGAATHVLPADRIAGALSLMVHQSSS